MQLQHRAERWILVTGNIGVPELTICHFRIPVSMYLENGRVPGHGRRRRVAVQFAKHPREFDMPLRRYFFLVFEEQNLVIEESPANLLKLLACDAFRKRNSANFRTQVGSEWPNVNM